MSVNNLELKKQQPHPGNTTQDVQSFKGRAFQLTCNNLESYEASVKYLKKSQMLDYIIACHELAPTTGHEHWHIYCHFNNARLIKLKNLKGAHVEVCRGSAIQNIDYIKKNGDITLEEGIAPSFNSLTVSELKKINDEDDLPDWKQYNLWSKLKSQETINILDWFKNIKVYYIWGPSGIGKSKKAKEIVLQSELGQDVSIAKFNNGYWNGVSSKSKIMIYDDFRDSHMPASEFINLIDYNKHIMNIKGAFVINNYELIIITSVQDIDTIYSNLPDEPRLQWLRRIEVIDLSHCGAAMDPCP